MKIHFQSDFSRKWLQPGKRILWFFFCLFFLLSSFSIELYAQSSFCLKKNILLRLKEADQARFSGMLYEKGFSEGYLAQSDPEVFFEARTAYTGVLFQAPESGYEVAAYYSATGDCRLMVVNMPFQCFLDIKESFTGSDIIHSSKSLVVKNMGELKDIFLVEIMGVKQVVEFRSGLARKYRNGNSILIYSPKTVKADINELTNISNAQARQEQKNREAEQALNLEQEQRAKEEEERLAMFQSLNDQAEDYFNQGYFEYAERKFNDALKIYPDREDVKQRILDCRYAVCNRLENKGDSLENAEQYYEAMRIYDEAKACSRNPDGIEGKITRIKEILKQKRVNAALEVADKSYRNKNYKQALFDYQKVLEEDPANKDAQSSIASIAKLLAFLEKRRTTTFSYESTNYYDYNQFRNALKENINTVIDASDNGSLRADYQIHFDTSGTNKSTIRLQPDAMNNGWHSQFATVLYNQTLRPAVENNYFLDSKSYGGVEASWKTKSFSAQLGAKGVQSNSGIARSRMEEFINIADGSMGRYSFRVKEKTCAGSTFSDVSLVSYKTRGPESAALSFLLPGLGALHASYGKEGKNTLYTFLATAGASLLMKRLSVGTYNTYKTSTSFNDMKSYYGIANFSNKMAIIFGTVSACVVITDFCHAISKGMQNRRETRYLRNELKIKPKNIQYNPVKL
jgi:tetratricopeptide (TPR) repeat protein